MQAHYPTAYQVGDWGCRPGVTTITAHRLGPYIFPRLWERQHACMLPFGVRQATGCISDELWFRTSLTEKRKKTCRKGRYEVAQKFQSQVSVYSLGPTERDYKPLCARESCSEDYVSQRAPRQADRGAGRGGAAAVGAALCRAPREVGAE